MHVRSLSRSVLLASGCVGALALTPATADAQLRHDLVPAMPQSAEGDSSRYLEGLGSHGRSQLLIHATHLAGLQGRALTGVAFRRDGRSTYVWHGGAVDLVVRIGAAASSVTAPSSSFRDNLPQPFEVFRGTIDLPATVPTANPIDWTAGNVVEITFDRPFAYASGDLVVEWEGTPRRGEEFGWPIDAVAEQIEGQVQRIGQACGGPRAADGTRAFIAPRTLVPGLHAQFDLSGEPGASAFLFLAATPLQQSLDLTPFGAPGCRVHVDPTMFLAATVSAPWADPSHGGIGRARIALPDDSHLLGANLAAQWLELGSRGLSTSEALDCRLAATLPSMGLALCSQREGGVVSVTTHLAPRVRFSSRP